MRVQKVINNEKSLGNINSLDINISSAGFVRADDGWRQSPLYAGFSRLYFVMDGEGYLLSERERVRLLPGRVYLAPCGDKCGFYTDSYITKLFFHINLPIDAVGRDAFESYGRIASMDYPIEKMKELTDAYLAEGTVRHLFVRSEIFSVASAFLTACPECLESSKRSSLVLDAIRYIRTHLKASLTVAEVAEAALSSESRLAALFRREVGNSVAWYVEDLIMSEAQNMLMGGKMSIGEISERLGFCDQFYFSRRFKRRFGSSPREYIKKSVK